VGSRVKNVETASKIRSAIAAFKFKAFLAISLSLSTLVFKRKTVMKNGYRF